MIDALFIRGLNPGPMLMVEKPDMFWFIVSALARVESPPRLMKGVPSSPLSPLLFAAIVLIFISKSPLCGMVFRRRT